MSCGRASAVARRVRCRLRTLWTVPGANAAAADAETGACVGVLYGSRPLPTMSHDDVYVVNSTLAIGYQKGDIAGWAPWVDEHIRLGRRWTLSKRRPPPPGDGIDPVVAVDADTLQVNGS